MADDGAQQGTRTCPVCDEAVSAQAMVCPSCNTDLSLFAAEELDAAPQDAEALKDHLMANGNGHLTDLLKAADGEVSASEPEGSYEDAFECPECGGAVPADAAACPGCGVEFEMEEVFECPMCKAMIDVTVNKCPSCGAEFETETEETPADISSQIIEEAEPLVEKPPVEVPPEPEQPAEPVSFADRLKQVKDVPTPEPAPKPAEPAKELSFAERMKAMKEGTLEEPSKAPEPEPVAEKPAPAPVPVQKESEAIPATPSSEAPEPAKPAPGGELSFSERMKSIKQAAQDKPAPSPAAEKPPEPAKPAPTPAPAAEQPVVSKVQPDPETARKENYKELPRYIGEVKKLLLLANQMKIDISASKALINKAVAAGKKRDLENAIKLVKEGKAGLERDLRTAMINKLRTFQNAIALEKKSGKDVSVFEAGIEGIKKSLEAGDFLTATEDMKKIEGQMVSTASASLPQAELEVISKTLEDATALHVNVDEAKSLFEEAKIAIDLDDNERASEMARKATDALTKILPGYIASEMRKAKITLREIKMMNVDITQPVNILKEANNSVRDGDYCEALSSIKNFKDFINQSKQ